MRLMYELSIAQGLLSRCVCASTLDAPYRLAGKGLGSNRENAAPLQEKYARLGRFAECPSRMARPMDPTSQDERLPMTNEKTSRRWFEDAVRCHVECHQGCAWCGRSHCVYRMMRGQQRVYSCQSCDFQASHDQATDQYFHVVGEEVPVENPCGHTR